VFARADQTMSDKPKAEKSDHAEPEAGEAKKKGGIKALLTKLPVLIGGVMVLEAVVLLVGVKLLAGGPAEVAAVEVHSTDEAGHGEEGAEEAYGEAPAEKGHGKAAADAGHDAPADGGHGKAGDGKGAPAINPKAIAELMLVEFRAPNKRSGRTYLYDVSIYVSVKGSKHAKVKSMLEQRKALITDRVRTIIAQSDPEKLGGGSEPGLETLRRQIKYQLNEVLGEGMIEEVIVPRCIPFKVDF